MRYGKTVTVATALLGLALARPAPAEEKAMPAGKNMSQMTLGPVPPLPTCATGAVESGDPAKGPSVILAKASKGCVIPWHWHTPAEHVMMVRGTARMEMKDGAPATLTAGGFALMPSHHVHQFTCTAACVLFIYSDAPFDIHYVDAKGNELAPDDALKAVKETAARPPQ